MCCACLLFSCEPDFLSPEKPCLQGLCDGMSDSHLAFAAAYLLCARYDMSDADIGCGVAPQVALAGEVSEASNWFPGQAQPCKNTGLAHRSSCSPPASAHMICSDMLNGWPASSRVALLAGRTAPCPAYPGPETGIWWRARRVKGA
eukprot:3649699-Rhodomonas_salina.1